MLEGAGGGSGAEFEETGGLREGTPGEILVLGAALLSNPFNKSG